MADKITKLSDAIRLGATFRPQCCGDIFAEQMSCALGAAVEALGYEYNEDMPTSAAIDALSARFPTVPAIIYDDITCANDGVGIEIASKTREQIADDLAKKGY